MAKFLYIFKGKFPWDGRLVKICKSLKSAGHQVLIVARWKGEPTDFEQWHGLDVIRACYKIPTYLSLPFPENPFWVNSLKKIINEFRPECIIVRDIFLVKPVKRALGSRTVPVIIDMAEHYPAAVREWKKYNQNPLTKFLVYNLKIVDKWERESVSISDYILTVCEEQVERLSKFYSFPNGRTEVIYNTPEISFLNPTDKIPARKPRVFIHHGYHTSEKPIDKFVEYFIEFASPNDSFQLLIAGPGECIPQLKEIVNKRNAKNVLFLGKYNFEELPKILEKGDIGVIPYPPNEFNNYTLHNKIFDYFAFGIPVVVSNAKPLKRLVEETNAGISLPIERESIKNFFDNIDNFDWITFSNNAFRWSRNKYNWESDEKRLLEFIGKVLNG
ncbi:MAG: glycosyltransferase family 4 protein [Ignavibacteria bacterium]|nr:glycosyltransferase family 4 protein [Ignavibacteria bacterium]